MYYSELVKKACVLMFEAHKNDLDKGGYPYVFHPFYLATQMEDEASTCVALLHDVIEDHGDEYTYTDLESAGFPKEVLDALQLLTHADGVAYMDYVKALAEKTQPGFQTAQRSKARKERHLPPGDRISCAHGITPIVRVHFAGHDRKNENMRRRTGLPPVRRRGFCAVFDKQKILQPQRLQDFLELLPGFGPGTSSLPRMRSTD